MQSYASPADSFRLFPRVVTITQGLLGCHAKLGIILQSSACAALSNGFMQPMSCCMFFFLKKQLRAAQKLLECRALRSEQLGPVERCDALYQEAHTGCAAFQAYALHFKAHFGADPL